ncbi:multicopper oxidase family protein [Aquipuribacter nitratireducens]|uniref:Multicopper oxidase family protein n=1 Tax=Aquipuribacter nitratireducens TaxID=650104 RepID=A0ABW0GN05_9MICO
MSPRPRRALVAAVAVSLAVPLVLVGAGVLVRWWVARTDTVGQVAFERPLHVPPLAPSRVEADGTRVFDLAMQPGSSRFTGEGESPTWGVDGAYLAPTLRAARGETVRVEVTNDLPEATNLHWHGMHLPARMDGGPHRMVQPGETWTPTWTVDQPAATTWYHPHAHGSTATHVARGLLGAFLLDDPEAAPEGLPDTYGVDDVPLLLQDVRLTGDGRRREQGTGGTVGPLGTRLLVNGTVGPVLDVTTEAVRLRLVNASAARVYDLVLSDARPFHVVATDGGLLAAPVEVDSLRLTPGERAEVVVRLSAGETVDLRSRPPALGVSAPVARLVGARDAFDVLRLRAADELVASPPLPQVLAAAPDVDEDDATREREMVLSGDAINGNGHDLSRVDVVVEAGAVERWVVRNDDGIPHNFHVHDVRLVVASLDGQAPPPVLRGWKDTVWVAPGTEVELVVRFGDHTDPDVPYMFHCHVLAHHDRGMMGQFVVVEPGTAADHPGTVGTSVDDAIFPSHDH